MNGQLIPERAVRLLRAKAAELEHKSQHLLNMEPVLPIMDEIGYLSADIALVASILADFMEGKE